MRICRPRTPIFSARWSKCFARPMRAALATMHQFYRWTPDASRAAVEARFAETFRLAERFVMAEDVSDPQRPRFRRLRASLLYLATYTDQPSLTSERQLVDAVLELESLLVLWRTRHARMAEKMIGRRLGTGGASVDYLERSLTLRVFPDLWEARTQVVPRDLAPEHPWTSPVPRG